MADLEYGYGNNIGGNHLIRCVPSAGIISLPLSGSPTFRDGFGWSSLYGTDAKKTYEEACEETGNGDVWTVSAGLFFPGDSVEVRAIVTQLKAWKTFVVECQDKQGLWRRLGDAVETLKMATKYSNGTLPGDPRGYTISFTGQMTSAPPILPQ